MEFTPKITKKIFLLYLFLASGQMVKTVSLQKKLIFRSVIKIRAKAQLLELTLTDILKIINNYNLTFFHSVTDNQCNMVSFFNWKTM